MGDGGEEGVLEAPRLAQALRVPLELARAALRVGEIGLEPSSIVGMVPGGGDAAGQAAREIRQDGADE